MRIKSLLAIFIGTVAAALLVIFSLYNGYIRFNYPTLSQFPLQGIDISNHQKQIRWDEIDKRRVGFVFIKATEGADFKDKSFQTNWKAARERDFIVGAYHFFTFCKSGEEQAKNFIDTVPLEPNTLPPVIDLEYGGNCQLTSNKEQVLAEIEVLISQLENFYHKKPILYVTSEFYNDFVAYKFDNNPIWIRDIYKRPTLVDSREWTLWQYANRGHLKGIDTFVDLNVFHGTEQEFKTLIE